MSTDLHLPQSLPENRLPAIKINTSHPSDIIIRDAPAIIRTENSDQECQTPKSPENKIPATLICPPAPKKPRRSSTAKRKLCELEFFEIVAREEVESFFKSSFADSSSFIKRRCPCT